MERLYTQDNGTLNRDMVRHAPVLMRNTWLGELGIKNIEDLLKFAEGQSINNAVREGVVFKRENGKFSFKVMNNVFQINTMALLWWSKLLSVYW